MGGAINSYIVEALTLRESEVLRSVALGHSNDEVGAQLSMTRDGVKYHLKNIYAKLGAARRTDAIRIAVDCGFLKQHRTAARHHVVASIRSQFARARSGHGSGMGLLVSAPASGADRR